MKIHAKRFAFSKQKSKKTIRGDEPMIGSSPIPSGPLPLLEIEQIAVITGPSPHTFDPRKQSRIPKRDRDLPFRRQQESLSETDQIFHHSPIRNHCSARESVENLKESIDPACTIRTSRCRFCFPCSLRLGSNWLGSRFPLFLTLAKCF